MLMKLLAYCRGKNLTSFILFFAVVIGLTHLVNLVAVKLGLINFTLTGRFLWAYLLQNIILCTVLYFWFYRRFPREREMIQWRIKSVGQLIGSIILIFASYFGLILGLRYIQDLFGLSVVPGLGQQTSLLAQVNSPLGYVSIIIAAVFLAPIIEEYVFRGWGLLCLPTDKWPFFSIVINGLLFALLHFQLAVLIPLVFLGCMLAWTRLRTQSILPGLIFHILNNSLAFLGDIAQHWPHLGSS
ncbi:CPBP family intramembrane metalloprotease [Candidatus Gracilibacteria bacterium]|nr:CPBP family intramembrane metalloprotease [Candidatus Gracilibacteria bacterium]